MHRLLCGLFLLVAVCGSGCHCCEHFENGLGDVVDGVGQISPIRKPWFQHADEVYYP